MLYRELATAPQNGTGDQCCVDGMKRWRVKLHSAGNWSRVYVDGGRSQPTSGRRCARAQCDIRICGVVGSEDRSPGSKSSRLHLPLLTMLRQSSEYIMPCRRLWKTR
jgi:hypothetical protein